MKYQLLDQLANHCGVHYISDIKNKAVLCTYQTYILNMDEALYSLEDWKDVCEYILGEAEGITSITQAKNKIIEWLNS
ncbi:hypothetical protein ACWG0P_04910 [Amedibacillus sp. YH-ame6]